MFPEVLLIKLIGFRFKIWQVFGFWISLRAELGKDFNRAAFPVLFLGSQTCTRTGTTDERRSPSNGNYSESWSVLDYPLCPNDFG